MKKVGLKSLIFGIFASIVMQLPFLGLLFALLAAPLMGLVPSLGTTSDHVNIGFAWVALTSPFAWIAFILYFSLLFETALIFIRLMKSISKR